MSEDDYKKVFAERLSFYMQKCEKTQNDIVRDFGYSASTVSDWCNGKKLPRMDKIQALADYFGIEKSDLIENKPKEKKYYINPETAKIAQQIYDDPDLHALFDAAADSAPEDMQMAADLLRRLKKTNPDG